jgi:hypothetical protein
MSKISKISNTCAGLLGASVAYYAQDMGDEQLRTALLSLIPPFTLFVAYIIKLLGNAATLSTFNFLLVNKSGTRLEELKEALADENLSDEVKKGLQSQYDETYLTKLNVNKQGIETLTKVAESARQIFVENIEKGYQDNPELQKDLQKNPNNKS